MRPAPPFGRRETQTESPALLVAYDISDLTNPKILRSYVLGHAAEEDAVNPNNHKVYVGNHEPSPTNVGCFVSVIDPSAARPYIFIDLPGTDCVQGIDVDPGLNTVNGTTHFGQKMYTFNSGNDTVAYSVNIRPAFDAFVAGLPPNQRFTIPAGWIIHMHDLNTDRVNHRAYQTIHTIATAEEVTAEDEEGATTVVESENEITGRWVAEVDTNSGIRDLQGGPHHRSVQWSVGAGRPGTSRRGRHGSSVRSALHPRALPVRRSSEERASRERRAYGQSRGRRHELAAAAAGALDLASDSELHTGRSRAACARRQHPENDRYGVRQRRGRALLL